jgi:hypothetical protein
VIMIGVDPGIRGAIAALDDGGALLSVEPTPLVPAGPSARAEFDLPAIRDRLYHWKVFASRSELFVTVERLSAMPRSMGGASANFARGMSRAWAWMLTALEIPYAMVTPQVWQRVMLAGTAGKDTKQRSIIAAQRLFPKVDLRREGKGQPDDNLADSVLLASYGRLLRLGGQRCR